MKSFLTNGSKRWPRARSWRRAIVLTLAATGLASVSNLPARETVTSPRGLGATVCAWSEAFHLPDIDRTIRSMVAYDPGSGSSLFVAGDFSTAGPELASNIARWDGLRWHALEGGIEQGASALAVFDGALYVAGTVAAANGMPTGHIARWDGSWSTVGVDGDDGTISALAVFDDGNGEALYATGSFSRVGGVDAARIAKFDGVSWQALGGVGASGLEGGFGRALAVYDDGLGPDLYVGGTFTSAEGMAISTIARWDGNAWSDVGTGLTNKSIVVNMLEVLDGVLYAGGEFDAVDGITAAHLARWNGTAWSDVGGGVSQQPPEQPRTSVTALHTIDLGAGASLYVAGVFDRAGAVATDNLARWDGTGWHAVGGGVRDRFGLGGIPFAVASYDDGSGGALYVAGEVSDAGEQVAAGIVRWDGSDFSTLGRSGLGLLSGFGFFPPSRAMTTFDDGDGAFLVAGGFLSASGAEGARDVVNLVGDQWQSFRSPNGFVPGGTIRDLAVLDDGGSKSLYVVVRPFGLLSTTTSTIMRWDGSTWSTFATALVAGGASGRIADLEVLDDGSGPALFVSGVFDVIGGTSANNIARFAGGSWLDIGTDPRIDEARSPVIFDPGGGSALFASVRTTAGEQVVMRRDGAAWTIVDGVFDGFVQRLAVYDAGSGPRLVAAGNFASVATSTGVRAANNIAHFDGSEWSRLGNGLGNTSGNTFVADLEVFDDGAGAGLYAGGNFIRASQGGLLVNHLARWDGTSWSALQSGGAPGIDPGPVIALLAFEDTLFALGNFRFAGGKPSRAIAAWECREAPLFADGFESGDTSAWTATIP